MIQPIDTTHRSEGCKVKVPRNGACFDHGRFVLVTEDTKCSFIRLHSTRGRERCRPIPIWFTRLFFSYPTTLTCRCWHLLAMFCRKRVGFVKEGSCQHVSQVWLRDATSNDSTKKARPTINELNKRTVRRISVHQPFMDIQINFSVRNLPFRLGTKRCSQAFQRKLFDAIGNIYICHFRRFKRRRKILGKHG